MVRKDRLIIFLNEPSNAGHSFYVMCPPLLGHLHTTPKSYEYTIMPSYDKRAHKNDLFSMALSKVLNVQGAVAFG